MDGLPEELLADVLRRLQPRSVAVCRSVCKGWRAVADASGMLLAVTHLMPRRLWGIYINHVGQNRPYFFSREPTSPSIDAALKSMPPQHGGWKTVLDHRNGLILYGSGTARTPSSAITTMRVCNPATRRWTTLPPRPTGRNVLPYLVFDPTASLHYDVLCFPEEPDHASWPSSGANHNTDEINDLGSVEWPPSSYAVQAFSSRTGRWEERRFVREGDTTVTLSDVWSDPWHPRSGRLTYSYSSPRCHGVYWREKFYLHCRGGFVIRLSLQEQKYLVIKTPKSGTFVRGPFSPDTEGIIPSVYLGKSKQGIYYTALYRHQIRVWVLHEASESCRTLEWTLRQEAVLKPSIARHYSRVYRQEEIAESWNLDRAGHIWAQTSIKDHDWDSDNDSDIPDRGEERASIPKAEKSRIDFKMSLGFDLLGFHPYKEIAFLGKDFDGFAYFLSTSKLQYLGSFYPIESSDIVMAKTHESFIYTPCMDDLLSLNHDGDDDDDDDDGGGGDDDDDYYELL
ncbi:hypothetical protein VPH35_075798 [Triticum aestivum]|uniref:uncharacterized protein n=1 Tax=Triticum aestivum TaxID=4565 RepID=UPI001D02047A|nr:uncharacterized protein LOC123089784 [Triticum aestivum]